MVALNLTSGNVVWDAIVAQPKGDNELERIADVGAAPLVLDGAQSCAVAFQGRIACFDLAKGSLVWSRDASSAGGLAADPLTLYMTDERGTVYAFDKSSGATVWKQDQLLARSVSAPLVLGEFVMVGDFQGYIHVLDRADGSFVARQSTDGSSIAAPPLPLGNNALVQTRKGGLYAIAVE
jgi:outer membrane protein assembly factor BamB